MVGIDFLKAQKEIELKRSQQWRRLRVISFSVLLFYCLLVFAIFAYWSYLANKNQQLELAVNKQKQRVVELKKAESLQLVLKQRLGHLSQLITQQRINYDQIITFLYQASSAGINLEEIKISVKGVSITGKADNAPALSLFLDKLNEGQLFSKIILTSSQREENGIYSFSFSLESNGG